MGKPNGLRFDSRLFNEIQLLFQPITSGLTDARIEAGKLFLFSQSEDQLTAAKKNKHRWRHCVKRTKHRWRAFSVIASNFDADCFTINGSSQSLTLIRVGSKLMQLCKPVSYKRGPVSQVRIPDSKEAGARVRRLRWTSGYMPVLNQSQNVPKAYELSLPVKKCKLVRLRPVLNPFY